MANILRSGISICLLMLGYSVGSQAQMVGDNVFLKGTHVELGIAPNAAFGSTVDAPTGFHNNVTQFFYDPGTGIFGSVNTLGFVADPDEDGWTVGTPKYFGDYYMPGDPQEGWAMQIAGVADTVYMPNFEFSTSGYRGGGMTGYGAGGGGIVSYSTSGTHVSGLWQGHDGALLVSQTTDLDTNKLYFTVTVVLTNTGSTTIKDIYYLRTVDPDNDEVFSGSYATNNQITYSGDSENRALVSTYGTVYARAYLGLGTKDCRAVPFIITNGLTPGDSLSKLWNKTAAFTQYTDSLVEDVGVGLVYKVGTLNPGDSTFLKYAYILRKEDLDSALDATVPALLINGVSINDYKDTIDACRSPVDTVPINIINSSFYRWHWSPSVGLTDTTGTSSNIILDKSPTGIVYTVTGTIPGGVCATANFTIEVSRGISGAVATNNSPFCAVDTLRLNLAVDTSYPKLTYLWTGPDGFTSTEINPVLPDVGTSASGVYTITIGVPGCAPTVDTTTATIVPLPAPPGVAPVLLCTGDNPYTLTADGTDLLWYTDPRFGTGTDTAPVVNPVVPVKSLYFLTQTVDGCTSRRDTLSVQVYQKVTAAFVSDTIIGCTFDTVLFTNSSFGAMEYTWDFGDSTSAQYSNAENPVHYYVPLYSPAQNDTDYNVQLLAYNPGCRDSVTHVVHLDATPSITLINVTPDQRIPLGESVSLNADGAFYYFWTPDNGTLDNPDIHNPIATPTDSTTYTVYGTNYVGCRDSAFVHIAVDYAAPEFIPNAFTPNGDGLNDVFRVTNIGAGKLLDFRVFNRWGQMIFETTDVTNGWDGTFNGKPQDMDTYQYLIVIAHAAGDIKQYKGNVTLIR